MRVAFVHDWLMARAGSEKVLEAMLELYPGAPIYTLVYDPDEYRDSPIGKRTVHTSFLQELPQAKKRYRSFLPIMPLAIEQFDLRDYDLVISSSHAVAKGVLTDSEQVHVSYVHTPIRYAWDLYHQYLEGAGLSRGLKSWIARGVLHYLRMWDVQAANRVDHFIANSKYVARRIKKVYRRDADVVYPPVDIERFRWDRPREDFYLTVSRLVPYKKVDLIVEAFSELSLPLVVIGGGPMLEQIRRMAGSNVTVMGPQPDECVTDHMERCKAFVYAADEDFGITPVEAQAAGAPVIAYGRGGVVETVVPLRTGILLQTNEVSAIEGALRDFDRTRLLDAQAIARDARRFSTAAFRDSFGAVIRRVKS